MAKTKKTRKAAGRSRSEPTKAKPKRVTKRASTKRKLATAIAEPTAKAGDVLDLEPIIFHWLEIEIIGTAPLITNRFSDDAMSSIMESQGSGGKKLKRPPREPVSEFLQAAHICKGKPTAAYAEKNIYGFPAVALKKAMANGNYRYGKAKDKVSQMGAFHVHGPWSGLIEIHDLRGRPCIPEMHGDYVKLPNGSASIAYRPYYFPWKMQVFIRYCPTLMSQEELVHALYIAGNCIGIGSWRTEKTGDKGSFDIGDIKYHGDSFQPPLRA